MVSEIGEQWSPKMAPASTAPRAPSIRGSSTTGASSRFQVMPTEIGISRVMVEKELPVDRAMPAASTNDSWTRRYPAVRPVPRMVS